LTSPPKPADWPAMIASGPLRTSMREIPITGGEKMLSEVALSVPFLMIPASKPRM
jgi:hypothetical protein